MKPRTKINLVLVFVSLILTASVISAQQAGETPEVLLERAIQLETVDGDLQAAIPLYQKVVLESSERSVAARAQLRIGLCYEKLGNSEARKAYQEVLNKFSDQSDVTEEARARLAALEKQAVNTPADLTLRRVWTGNTAGSISLDGRYLTFVSQHNLAVRELVTGESRRLTNLSVETGEFVERSIFSPDGKQIAYNRMNQDRTWDLCVIGLDGTGDHVLVHLDKMEPYENWVCPAGWSPDGRRVLAGFARTQASGSIGEIAFVSVEDGTVQIIKPAQKIAKSSVTGMRLSPDGRYIAYHAADAEGSQNDILLLSSDGSSDFPLIGEPSDDRAPAWTPDGKRLLFVSNRSSGQGFWMIEISDGKPKGSPALVKSDISGFERSIGFTREGAYFYASTTAKEDVHVAGMNPETGAIEGTPEVISAGSDGSNTSPAWSPDGRYLAWYRERTPNSWAPGASAIVIRSMQTGNEREISTNLILFGGICWFPEGQSLLASAFRAENDWLIQHFRVEVSSGETSLLMQSGGITPWPGLSPDGKTIFFIGGGGLRAYEVETGKGRELWRRSGDRGAAGIRVRRSLHVSPIGDQVAFVEYAASSPGDSIVKVVPTAGGEARELLRVTPPGFISGNRALAWTPDGAYLLVVKGNAGDPPATSDVTYDLLRIPASGGQLQTIRLAGPLHSLSVRPDGQGIAYTALSKSPTNELWVMENFLPQ